MEQSWGERPCECARVTENEMDGVGESCGFLKAKAGHNVGILEDSGGYRRAAMLAAIGDICWRLRAAGECVGAARRRQ